MMIKFDIIISLSNFWLTRGLKGQLYLSVYYFVKKSKKVDLMSTKTDLNALNVQLDNEIKRVADLEKNFRTWADDQREKFNEIRVHHLNQGDINVTEFKQILTMLKNIESANDETFNYLINTFKLLCP